MKQLQLRYIKSYLYRIMQKIIIKAYSIMHKKEYDKISKEIDILFSHEPKSNKHVYHTSFYYK